MGHVLDTKRTLRNTTIILIICIVIVAAFSVGPFIEKKLSTSYYIVTFDTGVGEDLMVSVFENATVVKPEEPKREGYNFVGWYHGDFKYDFDTPVRKSITLKAIWEKEKKIDPPVVEQPVIENPVVTHITVTFDVMGGSLIDNQTIKVGGTASIPNNPTREGYTFVEWQLDGKSFDFGTTLDKNITLVAIWKEN